MRLKKKYQLEGMVALGNRLRDLRTKAGISQMKLAELVGMKPPHGYKYILRLEKGLVPNPTIRTITMFLSACGATWKDIVDVLPIIKPLDSSPIEPELLETPVTVEPIIAPSSYSASGTGDEKLEEFYKRMKKVQQRAWSLFSLFHQSSLTRRGYISFLRATCTIIRLTPPQSISSELARLLEQAKGQGLDQKILSELQKICLEFFSS